MNYFSSTYGLVTKNDPSTENGGLFFAHYLVLKEMLNVQITKDDYELFQEKMNSSFVKYGLYLRNKNLSTRTVSQDELTGMTIASYILNTTHYHSIWNYLSSHFGNYPATGKNSWVNGGSYYAWAKLADSKISFLLAPWYTINLLISSNKTKQDTSSKLIYFTELHTLKNRFYPSLLWKYYSWRMKVMYGDKWIKELFAIYFHTEDADHPLIELSRKV
jgi:hypothetical protein